MTRRTLNLGSGANAVAIRASKIVAAGTRDGTVFAVVRYHLDGSRDGTFGRKGNNGLCGTIAASILRERIQQIGIIVDEMLQV